jgi:hypothetical protein
MSREEEKKHTHTNKIQKQGNVNNKNNIIQYSSIQFIYLGANLTDQGPITKRAREEETHTYKQKTEARQC